MKLLIGSVTKCEEIKQAVLSMELPLTYQGKKGLQMVLTVHPMRMRKSF